MTWLMSLLVSRSMIFLANTHCFEAKLQTTACPSVPMDTKYSSCRRRRRGVCVRERESDGDRPEILPEEREQTLGSKHALRTLPSCLRRLLLSRDSTSTSRSSKSSEDTAAHLSLGLNTTSRTEEEHLVDRRRDVRSSIDVNVGGAYTLTLSGNPQRPHRAVC